MMSVEQLYGFQGYLNNLLMFQYLYDEGIDRTLFSECNLSQTDDMYGAEADNFNNFSSICEQLFEIYEVYRDGHNNQEDIEYWLKEAKATEKYSTSTILVVIYDPLLSETKSGNIGSSYLHGEHGTVYQVEDGLILVFDEDYGEPDWTETIHSLLLSRRKALPEEAINHEMAI